MRIDNPRNLGLYVRSTRRERGQTQAELATAANVSRRWLSDLEAGKPTVEVGLVLRTLSALGLVLLAQPAVLTPGDIDIDEQLRRLAEPPPEFRKAGESR